MMRQRSLPFYCVILFLGSMAVFAETPGASYQITGVVVNSVTGNPVPRCHLDASLTLQSRGPGRGPAGRRQPTSSGVDADEHGRFSIQLSSAGAWHLTASAPGYVSQAFDEHGNYSSAVVLTPSTSTIDLQFRLPPQARISGSVLDEAGESVRGATVELRGQAIPGPGRPDQAFASRFFTQTDDRGAYEFANLPPGSYELAVQAKPWYANFGRQRQFSGGGFAANTTSPAREPSFDVTYQLTWYPGVDDPSQTEPIVLSAGEDRPADFHLVPIPSLHLQIIPPSVSEQADGRPMPSFPMIERIDSNGSNIGFSQTQATTGPQGQIDVSGLTPGTYRVRLQGQNQDSRSTIVELTQGSSRVIDFSAAASTMANVTIHFEGNGEDERPMLVEFTDSTSGQRYFPSGPGRPMPLNGRRGPQAQSQREITLQVPPGRYEVSVQDRGDSYLTGITAQGAEVAGRFVTVRAGDATCTLHMATGHATVNGIVKLRGQPSIGAAVLLVPAGLDDPGSFTTLSRDQSNTDGSFDFSNVVPGQYILIGIDHGWHVNWSDPSTLRNYLTQGVPIDIHAGQTIKQNIDAQAP